MHYCTEIGNCVLQHFPCYLHSCYVLCHSLQVDIEREVVHMCFHINKFCRTVLVICLARLVLNCPGKSKILTSYDCLLMAFISCFSENEPIPKTYTSKDNILYSDIHPFRAGATQLLNQPGL